MKTSLEIINKLSDKEAVKLDSQLVELANVKEIDALIVQGNKEFDASTSAITKIKASIQDVKSGYKQSAIIYNNALKTTDEVIKSAKDLGLDVPQLLLTKQQWLKDGIKEAQSKIVGLQNIEKQI
jgi:hypothetical protein